MISTIESYSSTRLIRVWRPLSEPSYKILSIRRIIVKPIVDFLLHPFLLLGLLLEFGLSLLKIIICLSKESSFSFLLLSSEFLLLLLSELHCLGISRILTMSSSLNLSLFSQLAMVSIKLSLRFKILYNLSLSL